MPVHPQALTRPTLLEQLRLVDGQTSVATTAVDAARRVVRVWRESCILEDVLLMFDLEGLEVARRSWRTVSF